MLRLSAIASLVLLVGCGDGRASEGTDGGPQTPHDGGVDAGLADAGTDSDGGVIDTDGGEVPPDGGVDTDAGMTTEDAGTTISLDLFELKGKVSNGFGGTQGVQILAPYVAVTPNGLPHAFDNRSNGLGCYADHYDTTHQPVADINDGTVTISGYHGGTPLGTISGVSSSMKCQVNNGNYACSYGSFNASKPAGSQAFNDTTNPLGSAAITFSNATSTLGTFSVSASATTTVTATGLDSLHYSATQDQTVTYACSADCTSSLVLVTLAATRNTANSVPSASASYGAVTCASAGGTSMVIPKEAIAAMLGGDTALKSVLTSVIVATPPNTPPTDSSGNVVNVLVGRGAFGIASL